MDRIADTVKHGELLTPGSMKDNNYCVNILAMQQSMSTDQDYQGMAANMQARTLWHSRYDQQDKTVEFSFYLGEEERPGARRIEHRSD